MRSGDVRCSLPPLCLACPAWMTASVGKRDRSSKGVVRTCSDPLCRSAGRFHQVSHRVSLEDDVLCVELPVMEEDTPSTGSFSDQLPVLKAATVTKEPKVFLVSRLANAMCHVWLQFLTER